LRSVLASGRDPLGLAALEDLGQQAAAQPFALALGVDAQHPQVPVRFVRVHGVDGAHPAQRARQVAAHGGGHRRQQPQLVEDAELRLAGGATARRRHGRRR
jgi:hypothetical protein